MNVYYRFMMSVTVLSPLQVLSYKGNKYLFESKY